MEYIVTIDNFDGPLDLLLHLIKKMDIDIYDISIEEVTKQYLNYINQMKTMNLDVASEYLVMASELIELKSKMLLPNDKEEETDLEENTRENLIQRLIEYKRYKEMLDDFKNLEQDRKCEFTKEASNLDEFETELVINETMSVNDLVEALNKFLQKQKIEVDPIETKITRKEYSIKKRNQEIKNVLKEKKKVSFEELFDVIEKNYIVVTFLSVLYLARNQELVIKQDNNFNKIILSLKESD